VTKSCFIILRKPLEVIEGNLDAPIGIPLIKKKKVYSGVSRGAWLSIDVWPEEHQKKKIYDEIVNAEDSLFLWGVKTTRNLNLIQKTYNEFSSPLEEICFLYECSTPPKIDGVLYGFDVVNFTSLIAYGIFENISLFQLHFDKLNSNGLFDTISDAKLFMNDYAQFRNNDVETPFASVPTEVVGVMSL